ncbi:FAD-dependent oxidoreductase [Aureimonas sp. Leaf324]|uniref:NAD(P)/FAD-dependent oxidoreductase n=1 Tax=Aureimonas sp. Leaf324 TaxID=1736336 RepID=UPI0006F51370|nr:FAD-dependent oxidoreductase [Aureimonas sp. Leaf324]KQQ80646.1 NADH dehydrogenase [Aureimonas sp. Leaf324]
MVDRATGRRVLILGGGAGGLELASQLAGPDGIEVTLVDREMTHLWKPRLHEFAAGTVSSTLAEISFYMLARMRGFHFEQGEVRAVDRAGGRVELAPMHDEEGRELAPARFLAYDLLVVALGGVTPDFGIEGVSENAVRLDRPEDAEDFRTRFAGVMIRARASGMPAEVVIVGSGATGTELAAHLRDSETGFLLRGGKAKAERLLGITILESADVIMPGIDDALRAKLVERLKDLDVKTVTDAKVAAIEPKAVRSISGERWPADVAVWAAGLAGQPVLKRLADFELDDKGRIRVDRTLRSTVDERITVMGDAASMVPKGSEKPLPPTAQVASQQADYLAETIPLLLKGQPVEPFEYRDRGRLVQLGRAGTVGRIGSGYGDDFLIHGQFATAAYNALQRQHQWKVLGRLRGTVAIFADMLSPAKGPALKLHG